MPNDVIEITDELYGQLLDGQANGKRIIADANGIPMLADQPFPTNEQLISKERVWRDRQIAATDYLAMPDYPLTDAQRSEMHVYRQALRDWPAAGGFPTQENRPQPPAWLAQVLGATA